MEKIRKLLLGTLFVFILPFLACSAEKEIKQTRDDISGISLTIPSTVDITKGGEMTIFIRNGQLDKSSDSFMFESSDGISYSCTLVDANSNECILSIPDDCESGYYNCSYILFLEYRKNTLCCDGRH